MSHDPYTPPTANLVQKSAVAVALYSPMQAALGSLLGGPVGVIYFLRRNFITLGNQAAAQKTVTFGILSIALLFVAIMLLPADFPSTPFNLAYILAARFIAEKYQMTKQAIIDSPDFVFESNWKVFGMGLLCFLGSAVAFIGLAFALGGLG